MNPERNKEKNELFSSALKKWIINHVLTSITGAKGFHGRLVWKTWS